MGASVQPNPFRLPALLLPLLLLGGCATIAEEDCAGMDWYALGIGDGRNGYPIDRINAHREACQGVGIAPDSQAWLDGRAEGLHEYCRLTNAIELGYAGSSYAGVCGDPAFYQLYSAARRVNDAEQRIGRIDGEIARVESELEQASKQDDHKRRKDLREELEDLDRERRTARAERNDAEHALDRLRRELGV